MVKDDTTYRKFDSAGAFNAIASRRSKVLYLPSDKGQLCAVGANKNVIIWNLHTKEEHQVLGWEAEGKKTCVTRLAVQPGTPLMAVGYVDGSIRIFNWHTGSLEVTLSGHRSTITTFDFSSPGLLISGALDTTVIVWDVVAEAGLYRLKGHKAPVTQVALLTGRNVLISCAKDSTVKFWDLESQHCFLTLPEISSEVRSFILLRDQRLLLTLCKDNDNDQPSMKCSLTVWKITFYDEEETADEGPSAKKMKPDFDPLSEGLPEQDADLHILKCEKVDCIQSICGNMVGEPSGRFFVCFEGKALQMFMVRTEKEMEKRLKKGHKKRDHDGGMLEVKPSQYIRPLPVPSSLRIRADVRSVDIRVENPHSAQLVCLCVNNSLLTLRLDSREGLSRDSGVLLPGHRGEANSVAVSSDSLGLLTAGSHELKLWKRSDLQCLRTMPCRKASCAIFAPGDQYAVVGCMDGRLHICDLGSSEEECFEAHGGAIKSICMSRDKKYVVTAASDKMVSIWKFAFQKIGAGRVLTLEGVRTYEMSYDIAVAKFSPKSKFLGVGIRDGGVNARIYRFPDLSENAEEKKLKMVHKLYSHSLPLTCMDFSDDDELLVTGSMDKSLKIWGMDFADVHRSLLAEQDVITCVQFLPKTHFFFSGGRDGSLKQWDADNFQRIRTLQGHFDPINALAVCPKGLFVVTSSRDNSVRVWERTSETFNLLEEREKEHDLEDEEALVHEDEAVIPGEASQETGLAGKKTIESVKSTEKLLEAMQLYKTELEKMAIYRQELLSNKKAKQPEPDVMLRYRNMTALEYLRSVLMGIRANDLEDVLISLPFSLVRELLPVLPRLYAVRREVDRADKIANFLVRIHHDQLATTRELEPVLAELSAQQSHRSQQDLDMGGFISAAANFLARKLGENAFALPQRANRSKTRRGHKV